MLVKILIGITIVVVALVVIIATRPSDFRIVRTATMAAPPPVVFEQVNDFHKWGAWSPWEKMDPAMRRTYGGPPTGGVGQTYAWAGNKKVGEGRMTLTESRPSESVRIKLEFFKPFAATNNSEFTFEPKGEQTAVTWSMTGRNNFMGKAFCLFMDMDKMVGTDFEKGLAAMKSLVESAPQQQHAAATASR